MTHEQRAMTSGELTKKVQALAEDLGERHRIVGHDMHCVELGAGHVFLIERMEKFSRIEKLVRVSYIAALFDPCHELGRSDRVETWSEIEAWVHGFADRIRRSYE